MEVAIFSRGTLFILGPYIISEGCIASTIVLGGVFISLGGGCLLLLEGWAISWGVSASHVSTCTCTESKGHVISYCLVTRSKVNDTVF